MDKFPGLLCFNHESKAMACYCPDCVEALCSECSYYHTLHLKHRPVPNVFIKFMPAFLLLKINRCSKHSQEVEFYASNHGNACCSRYSKTVHGFCDIRSENGSTKNIKLNGEIMFKVNAGDITGCTTLPSGEIVFVDNKYDCLVIHNKDGSFNRNIDLLNKPYDATYVAENKIAVTQDCAIILINLETDLTEQWIDIGWKCSGVNYLNNMLIVTYCDGKGIQFVDLDGNMINKIQVPTHGITKAHVHGDKLYFVAFYDEYCVYCSDLTGKILWTYQHKKLKGPHQITTDYRGFVYVVYEKSLKVLVISPDGRSCKVLLCEQDGLHFPKTLHISNNSLLVANSTSCTAFRYKIQLTPDIISKKVTRLLIIIIVLATCASGLLALLYWS